MNFKVIQFIFAGIIFAIPSLMGIIETKRFDAKPKERLKYLNYMMPKELRFSAPAIEADRGNLLVIVSESNPTNLLNPPFLLFHMMMLKLLKHLI
jgi:hypothetical protein